MLDSLIVRWGYATVIVGTFLEGEAVLIVAGACAHRGLLSLPLVVAAAFVGSVCGDQLWFHVGRHAGRSIIERHHGLQAGARRAERWLARRGSVFVFGFRFVYGFRTITPLLLGASGYPVERFVVLNVCGAAVWAAAFGSGGWALAASLETLLRRTLRVEELFAAAIVVALVLTMSARAFAASSRRRESRPANPER